MKMKNPEMEIVRFGAEDILTVSGGSTISWSLMSYKAASAFAITGDPSVHTQTGYNEHTEQNVNNIVDGVGLYNPSGKVLTKGNYYHYDVNSTSTNSEVAYLTSWNFLTCNEENCGLDHLNHHYSN